MNNQKGIAPIVILLVAVIFLVVGVLVYQSKISKEKNQITKEKSEKSGKINREENKSLDVPVVYEKIDIDTKKSSIWLFDYSTGTKRKIIEEGGYPILSSNKKSVAYEKFSVKTSSIYGDDIATLTVEIYLYNLKTGENKLLKTFRNIMFSMLTLEQWSPNDEFLTLDQALSPTGMERKKTIINTTTGEEIISFETVGYSGNYHWLSNEEIIFLDPQVVEPRRYYGDGKGKGIAKINPFTKEKKIFQRATGLKEYGDLNIQQNGDIILFSLIEVPSADKLTGSQSKEDYTTHWIMDKNGKILKKLPKSKIITERSWDIVARIRTLLPSDISKEVFSGDPIQVSKDWYFFEVQRTEEWTEFFIININDKDTFKKVDEIIYGSINPEKSSKKIHNLKLIQIAMEMYYDDNGAYLSSAKKPAKIGSYLDFPKDVSPYDYNWIDNTEDGQKFCVWVKLDKKGYAIITQSGVKEISDLNVEPVSLTDCESY